MHAFDRMMRAPRVLTLLLVVATAALVTGAAARAGRAPDQPADVEVIAFDVAENGARFVFDEAPVFDDGLPTYGNGFVTDHPRPQRQRRRQRHVRAAPPARPLPSPTVPYRRRHLE